MGGGWGWLPQLDGAGRAMVGVTVVVAGVVMVTAGEVVVVGVVMAMEGR